MSFREIRQRRLALEQGCRWRQGGTLPVALVYPSPYSVGMSSLGFQTVHRLLEQMPDVNVERAFLPDDLAGAQRRGERLETYESGRPVGDYAVLAFGLAYELELAGLVSCMDLAGVPSLARERTQGHPLVIVGGPLTFSNPVPAGPFADVIIVGEAEQVLPAVIEAVRTQPNRRLMLEQLSELPGCYIPAVHGEAVPPPASPVPGELLPARSRLVTPEAELTNMFLVEAERGCHRRCSYCVMRRSPDLGGMRAVSPERVLATVPAEARRVGLVGAAVTDHPGLKDLLRSLIASGREVGISSLRADRLDDELVGLLRQGGYRTLTTAMDGASQRMRDMVQRGTGERHLLAAAELSKRHGMSALKLYLMLGLPGETDADIDELGRFAVELAAAAPRLVLAMAPFVAKRRTPFDGAAFTPVNVVSERLATLRSALRGRAEVRVTSPKWAWFEYRLAQGGFAAGMATAAAARAGGRFADWRRAFAEVPLPPVRTVAGETPDHAAPSTPV